MVHDPQNPRTRKYSKLRTFIRDIELIFKKGFLCLFIFANFFFHSRKKNSINIENYNKKDNRFINYFFFSLKNEYNFSYDLSFSVLDFVKKVGIKNFLFHSIPNIFIKNESKLKFCLNKKKLNKNELNFNTNYFGNINKDCLILPYYIYPRLYNNDRYNKLNFFNENENEKKIKILFSGSTNYEVYSKFQWVDEDGINLLNRVEIINFVINNYKNKIFFLKSFDDLKKIDYFKTPIVLSINDNLVKKTKTNLTNSQHFEIISRSQFLLTAPGADMPLCHHLIEGIKMRSIPISNYANLHKPILPNDSYLHFSTFETLKNSIDNALTMTKKEIHSKQIKLERFYKEALSPASFLKSFKNRSNNEILACNDAESLEWLKK